MFICTPPLCLYTHFKPYLTFFQYKIHIFSVDQH
nr:MAG TPA: hypothetical protein [Caudoviricetes sp.]